MRGTIRSTEKVTFEESAPSVEEARANAIARVPSGFEVTSATAMMKAGTTQASVTAVAQSTKLQEIEADTFEAMRAATPGGWQLLNIRA